MTADALDRGRAALRTGDATGARELLAVLDPTPDVLEVMAAASFVLLEFERAIDEMERAHAGFRAAGDGAGAARTARVLGGMHGSTSGNWAVAGGWIARAKSLLSDDPTGAEPGWVALTEGMFTPDREYKEACFRRAIGVGHDTDPQLAIVASAYLGASYVHGDRLDEGMRLLDETMAAVAAGDVDDFMIMEEVFCQLFSACERAHDVGRAEQWMDVGESIATRRRLPAVSAYCHTHYGGLLTAAGRWPEADTTLTEAVRLWTMGRRTQKAGALVRLAELRIRQGRFDEAATLLDGQADPEADLPRAALHLARSETALALDVLEHALRRSEPAGSECLPLFGLLVDARLAAGEDVEETIAAMAECAAAAPTPYARGMLAHARGRAGHGDAPASLRDAFDLFTEAQLPWESALCRLDLARACMPGSPEVAIAHARAALDEFERLQSGRYAGEAAAVLRQLGERVAPPRTSGQPLTKREVEVAELLGEGLSNPEIAGRLFISRKTVEHHVGNILLKLGLRNRAEVAAYVVRQEPAVK